MQSLNKQNLAVTEIIIYQGSQSIDKQNLAVKGIITDQGKQQTN